MLVENNQELNRLIKLVEGISKHSGDSGFNGDKREIFERLSGLEQKVLDLCSSVDKLSLSLPCKDHVKTIQRHNDRINMNTLLVEKAKLSFLMAVMAMFMSISTIVGGIYTVLTYFKA